MTVGMTDRLCPDFECGCLGRCINADSLCNDLQCCPWILRSGKCSVCVFGSVCIRKEVPVYGKHNKHDL